MNFCFVILYSYFSWNKSNLIYSNLKFIKAWTQVLCKFKSYLQRVVDLQWWGSLTMVPAGNKAKHFLLVNHTIKTIFHDQKILVILIVNFQSLMLDQAAAYETPSFWKYDCWLVVKIILSCLSGSVALSQLNPIHKKGP